VGRFDDLDDIKILSIQRQLYTALSCLKIRQSRDSEGKSVKASNLIQILGAIILDFEEVSFHFFPSLMTMGILKKLI
jgi:hypothetical protein